MDLPSTAGEAGQRQEGFAAANVLTQSGPPDLLGEEL